MTARRKLPPLAHRSTPGDERGGFRRMTDNTRPITLRVLGTQLDDLHALAELDSRERATKATDLVRVAIQHYLAARRRDLGIARKRGAR